MQALVVARRVRLIVALQHSRVACPAIYQPRKCMHTNDLAAASRIITAAAAAACRSIASSSLFERRAIRAVAASARGRAMSDAASDVVHRTTRAC